MSTESLAVQQPKLPTMAELRNENTVELAIKGNALNVLLNEKPPDSWVKVNKYAGNTRYIPIAIQEWLMTRIFVKWHVEVLHVSLIANSIGCTVRVHYQSPIDNEWRWTDGVGAVPIQIDSKQGAGATDFANMKSNAVQIGLPAAKSYAFKDAVETLGRIFGKDLNRKDELDYRMLLGQFDSLPISEEELATLESAVQTSGIDRKALCEFLNVKDLSELNKGSLQKAMMRTISYEQHNGNTSKR